MALSDRNPRQGATQGLPCSVASLLAQLDGDQPEDAKTLRKWLASPWRVFGHGWIEEQLRSEGYDVGMGTVGKHRRGQCRCTKSPK